MSKSQNRKVWSRLRRRRALAQRGQFDASANDCALDEAASQEEDASLALDEGCVVGADDIERDPPFDPPDPDDDIFHGARPERGSGGQQSDLGAGAEDEDPPFDPPDPDDDIFRGARIRLSPPTALDAPQSLEADETAGAAAATYSSAAARPFRAPAAAPGRSDAACEQAAPPIAIHVSWDRAEFADLAAGFRADPRMARTEITLERGGLEGAIVRFAAHKSPNLLILDTTLRREALLLSLDRLAEVIEPDAKVIIIGAVNDIGLLRELAARGVDDYFVPPIGGNDLVRAVCDLYADADKSRVIAVIGARGGVGASTVARNLAWSIAERQQASAALLDLDLAFGAAGLDSLRRPPRSIADALIAPDRVDDAFLERIAAKRTQRLQVLTAPATLEHGFEPDGRAFEAVIKHARRTSAFVILDLPHTWNAWVKETLLAADEVVVVASPDLASLRNTTNLLEVLQAARTEASAPIVALSMVGVPQRPEVLYKDFGEAVGAAPFVSLAFDPGLFGLCEMNGRMLGEAAPLSKAAAAIDALATRLTGRDPVAPKSAAGEKPGFRMLLDRSAEHAVGASRRGLAPIEQDRARAAETDAGAVRGRDAEAAEDGEVPPEEFEPSAADAPCTAQEAAATLDLIDEAPAEAAYLAKAREAALAELQALEDMQRALARKRMLKWAAAGLIAPLLLGCVWYLQKQRAAAIAAEPQRPARASAHVALAPPAAPASPIAARYAFAMNLLEVGRAEEAAMLLRRAADAGAAIAQYRLAKLYERGQGVPPDLEAARQWTERAAAGGNRRAMHDLGVYHALGEGAPRDEAAAFRWFRQAAELGVADSQYNLGLLYAQGRGVRANAPEALFWLLVAAGQGDHAAAARIPALEAQITATQAEQARVRARAFRPRAANTVANGDFAAVSQE